MDREREGERLYIESKETYNRVKRDLQWYV
jgi:hypothetical protein